MDYVSIAQSIAELGVLVLIAGIFLGIVIKNNKKQDEFNSKLFETVINQVKAAAGGHVLTEKEDRTAMKIDNIINSFLQSAVTDLKASRAMVARYHNGGKDMNSISFLKLSVTNESVSLGCQPVISHYQNQFRSILAYPVAEIDRAGYCTISNIEDLKEKDVGAYELLKGRNVRSVYCHQLVNATGYVVGAVLIAYNTDNAAEEDPIKVQEYISHMADRISGLMNMKEM